MASVASLSLRSRTALPDALLGRRERTVGVQVRIGYGGCRSRPIAESRAGAATAGRSARSASRSVQTRAVANSAVMNLPGMGSDGQTWDPLGLGKSKRVGWDAGDNAWNTDERNLEGSGSVMALSRGPSVNAMGGPSGGDNSFNDFMNGKLPGKIATILGLLIVSRVGTYIPISGVDRAAFAESLQGGGSVLGYVDTLTGGSISKLGIFSLGIVPYINSSIIFQVSLRVHLSVSTCAPR